MGYRVSRRKTLFGLPWFDLKAEVDLFNSLKLSCVYALGPKDSRRPIKVSWTGRAVGRFTDMQVGNPSDLEIYEIAWMAGPPLARRAEAAIHEILDTSIPRVQTDWFSATAEDVAPAFKDGLAGIPTMTHEAMMSQVVEAVESRTRSLVSRARSGLMLAY